MADSYDFHTIEPKWQYFWEAHGLFRAVGPGEPGFDPDQPKYYVLNMFPYPSGAGLHVGHPLSYTAVDISGWLVRNETGERFLDLPAGTTVAAGGSIRVVTGCGNTGGDALYWCSESSVWSISDNTIILRDQLGNVVDRRTYEIE